MELLLFLAFFLLSLGTYALTSYYFRLLFLSGRENFEKRELTDWLQILPREILGIFESGGSLNFGILSFCISAFGTYIWTLLGGLIGSPHYTSEFGNYFFLSGILYFFLIIGYPYAKDLVLQQLPQTNPDHILVRLMNQDESILTGSGLSLTAAGITVYGMYHQIFFLFVFLNLILVWGIMLLWKNGKIRIPGIVTPGQQFSEEEENWDSDS